MPIKQAAIKALRQTKKREARNQAVRRQLDFLVWQMEKLISAKNKAEAQKQFRLLTKQVDKAAKRNIIHQNTANRIKSRVSAHIKKLG